MKKLSLQEFAQIYKKGIRRDFPLAERRPLFTIKWAYKKGKYSSYAMMKQDEVQAYATFFGDVKADVLLLDYFAVSPGQRGGGIGSVFLEKLKEKMNVRGVFLECESPESALSLKERSERIRRIYFYLKNGAKLTNTLITVIGVEYRILWLPIKGKLGALNPGDEVEAIYASTPPNFLYKNLAKAQYAENHWR